MTNGDLTSDNDKSAVKLAPRGFGILLAIGPGVVVAGSVLGSGELINTPVQAAKFGFVLLWAVIVSCLIKYFLQVEIGRHCLAHGRTTFEALNTLPGPKIRGTSWVGLSYMAGFVLTLASSVGMLRASAGLLHSLLPIASDPMRSIDIWTVLVFLIVLGVLWRGVYDEMEKFIMVLVLGFSLSVVIGLVLIQRTDYQITGEQVVSGLQLSLGGDAGAAAFAVVSLLGALGATANELFMYPYWILEKGYARNVGPRSDPQWADRARGWIRVLQVDALICTVLATVITAAYFLLGAAVLHDRGPVPSGDDILPKMSTIYTTTYGTWAVWIYAVGALCTLFSTLVVGLAAPARMWADMFVSLKLMDGGNQRARRWVYRISIAATLGLALTLAITGGRPPEEMVIFAQYVAGLYCTPLLMFAICWLAFHTDKRVRMNRTSAIFLILSVAVITACIVTYLALESGIFGGV